MEYLIIRRYFINWGFDKMGLVSPDRKGTVFQGRLVRQQTSNGAGIKKKKYFVRDL